MIRDLFYSGFSGIIVAHVETPFCKGSRPVDQSRYLYDSNNPEAVMAECERAVTQGVQAFMYNSYAKGSFEDKARDVWMAATQKAGMKQCINVDGANITSGPAYLAYLDYTVSKIHSLQNYLMWKGKPIVTVFGKPGEQPAWFQAAEQKHPDLCFVYYDTPYGKNKMDWVKVTPDPVATQEAFCAKYSNLHDGGLYIPMVTPGFDDTVMRKVNDKWQGDPNGTLKATSVWPSGPNQYIPARVTPRQGPNVATLVRCINNINNHYSDTNQCDIVQIVTWNDLDEGTNVCRGVRQL